MVSTSMLSKWRGLMEIYPAIKHLKEDSLVVWVGGYDGKVAANALNAMRDLSVKMHVIEPCPKNFKIMCRKLLKYTSAICHKLAITRETGETMLNVCHFSGHAGSSGSNSVYKGHLARSKKIPVQGCNLDDFLNINGIDHVDLLKLNCEGAEYQIFPGKFLDITDMIAVSFHAKNAFFNSEPFIQKRKEIYEHLESKGFILEIGKKWLKCKKHINQLWRKHAGSRV